VATRGASEAVSIAARLPRRSWPAELNPPILLEHTEVILLRGRWTSRQAVLTLCVRGSTVEIQKALQYLQHRGYVLEYIEGRGSSGLQCAGGKHPLPEPPLHDGGSLSRGSSGPSPGIERSESDSRSSEDEFTSGMSGQRLQVVASAPGGRYMSQLSREECIELGLSVPSGPLIGWATEQLAVAKGRQDRLVRRGVTPGFLNEVKLLLGTVSEMRGSPGRDKNVLPPEVSQAQRVREEAFDYWLEAKQMLKIEFGTCPEIQARCRLGVRTGRLLANLCREVECVVAVLREFSPHLRWLGADESFINDGDVLIGKLKEAQAKLFLASQTVSATFADLCCEKGKLYDLTRKLVRIGHLEYLHEPEQAAAFNYTLLRKELRAGSEVRAKTVKAVVR